MITLDTTFRKAKDSLKKWSPILDSLKATDESMRQILADYAEHDQQLTSEIEWGGINAVDLAMSLLPISLKILSQLNLKDKTVVMMDSEYRLNKKRTDIIDQMTIGDRKEEECYKEFSVGINHDMQISIGTEKCVQYMESVLMDEMTKYFNKELETKNTFYINKIVDSLETRATGTYPPQLVMRTTSCVE